MNKSGVVGFYRHLSQWYNNADRILQRLLSYRIYDDSNEKLNLSLKDTKWCLLLVSQFTLAADTRNRLRPGLYCVVEPNSKTVISPHMQGA
jgi:D-Tyr-tRNAtyr deacylase